MCSSSLFLSARALQLAAASSASTPHWDSSRPRGRVDPASSHTPAASAPTGARGGGGGDSSHWATSSSEPGRAMLELARQHLLERIQFGQPIRLIPGGATPLGLESRRARAESADSLPLAAAWDEPSPSSRHRGHGQGRGGAVRPHRGASLPAGPGRHRLHLRSTTCTVSSGGTVVLDQLLGVEAARSLTCQLGADAWPHWVAPGDVGTRRTRLVVCGEGRGGSIMLLADLW